VSEIFVQKIVKIHQSFLKLQSIMSGSFFETQCSYFRFCYFRCWSLRTHLPTLASSSPRSLTWSYRLQISTLSVIIFCDIIISGCPSLLWSALSSPRPIVMGLFVIEFTRYLQVRISYTFAQFRLGCHFWAPVFVKIIRRHCL